MRAWIAGVGEDLDFVRSLVVMQWIESGYRLMWATEAPHRREMENSSSASEHHEFVSNAVAEMVAEKAITMLPPGEKPWVVSPLEVVPKKGTDKFRLTFNMKYVNGHLGKKAFKFEGLKDLSDLAERGDHAVSYDLMSGYYHLGLDPRSRILSSSSAEGGIMLITASPLDCQQPLGFSPR
jgi:hypothetical protein